MSIGRTMTAVLTVTASLLFGRVIRARTDRENKLLSAIIADISTVEKQIEVQKRPIAEIVEGLSAQSVFGDYWEGILHEMETGLSFEEAAAKRKPPEICTEADNEIMARGLGTDTRELRSLIGELEKIRDERIKQSSEKGRITGMLSVFAGLSIALLII